MAPSDIPPWSELPHHIIGLFVDRLSSSPDAAAPSVPRAPGLLEDEDSARFRAAYRSHHTDAATDRARFRAVCRSFHAAVREHQPRPARRLPWTVLCNGAFITDISDDDDTQILPSWPKKAWCIGATDDWLTMECKGADDPGSHIMPRSYHLHNPFSAKTVPLPEIDAVIGNSSNLFNVRKVLMRSTPRDIVAFMTNNYNYPIILVRPGKGVWFPRPRSAPFIYIIDIVFVGDKLYGITKAEDLISLDVAFDVDGKPTITRIKRVIRHPTKKDDLSNMWSNADFTRIPAYVSPPDDAYDLWSDVDEKYSQDDDVDAKDEEDDETLPEKDDIYLAECYIRKYTGDDTISEAIDFDTTNNDLAATTCHIMESLGKLLMVRRKLQWNFDGMNYTRSADVFEANITTGEWMPVTTAGLDGQALFISRSNCMSIRACGEVEKDTVYFVDTGDVLNMKSQAISQPHRDLRHGLSMWMFPPAIVVG